MTRLLVLFCLGGKERERITRRNYAGSFSSVTLSYGTTHPSVTTPAQRLSRQRCSWWGLGVPRAGTRLRSVLVVSSRFLSVYLVAEPKYWSVRPAWPARRGWVGQCRTAVPVPGRQPRNMMRRIGLRNAMQKCVVHYTYASHTFHVSFICTVFFFLFCFFCFFYFLPITILFFLFPCKRIFPCDLVLIISELSQLDKHFFLSSFS